MKLPGKCAPVYRTHHPRHARVNGHNGIPEGVRPQSVWCEDVCHQSYAAGSSQHIACLRRCRRD